MILAVPWSPGGRGPMLRAFSMALACTTVSDTARRRGQRCPSALHWSKALSVQSRSTLPERRPTHLISFGHLEVTLRVWRDNSLWCVSQVELGTFYTVHACSHPCPCVIVLCKLLFTACIVSRRQTSKQANKNKQAHKHTSNP